MILLPQCSGKLLQYVLGINKQFIFYITFLPLYYIFVTCYFLIL